VNLRKDHYHTIDLRSTKTVKTVGRFVGMTAFELIGQMVMDFKPHGCHPTQNNKTQKTIT